MDDTCDIKSVVGVLVETACSAGGTPAGIFTAFAAVFPHTPLSLLDIHKQILKVAQKACKMDTSKSRTTLDALGCLVSCFFEQHEYRHEHFDFCYEYCEAFGEHHLKVESSGCARIQLAMIRVNKRKIANYGVRTGNAVQKAMHKVHKKQKKRGIKEMVARRNSSPGKATRSSSDGSSPQAARPSRRVSRGSAIGSLRPSASATSVASGATPTYDLSLFSPASTALALSTDECTLIQGVTVLQLLSCGWSKPYPRNHELAPDATLAVERFNRVSYWVSRTVLAASNPERRVAVVQHFVEIAVELRELQNFNGVMEILAGLNNVAVQRLKLTWAGLSEQHAEWWAELNELMSTANNYALYREQLREASWSAVPFLGVVLRDMTFIKDGNEYMSGKKKINLATLRMLGEVMHGLQRFQFSRDLLQHNNADHCKLLQSEYTAVPEDVDDQLFERSVMIEPRTVSSTFVDTTSTVKRLQIAISNTGGTVEVEMQRDLEPEDILAAVSEAVLWVPIEKLVFLQGRAQLRITKSTMAEFLNTGVKNDDDSTSYKLYVTAGSTINFAYCKRMILRVFSEKGKVKECDLDVSQAPTPELVIGKLKELWPGTCRAFFKRKLPDGSVEKTAINRVTFPAFLSCASVRGELGELVAYIVREDAIEKMKVY
eukprot:TRINITY_DN111_c0_g1_i10.p1 TRINITY_DN111_c0_g1~~TRINITY_DN111_c0_g1_i10.p1  ORF type:complete len:659 (-),score=182.84 TRINITY_DN111_c0_g1_i10:208-2184(-)